MPLGPPPAPARLRDFPGWPAAGRRLHRIFRRERSGPWWFASLDPEAPAQRQGRFDLPAPDGTCYLGCSAVAAVLEAFQEHDGLLPDVELRHRLRAEVVAPPSAPDLADLAAPRARGWGVTAAVWSGGDRPVTQAWAEALRRAGWLGTHQGVQHDPAGRQRAVALFDRAGQHPPYDDPEGWTVEVFELADDGALSAELAAYGIEVIRSDPQLPVVDLDDTDLI